jgi:chromosome partitioning protein
LRAERAIKPDVASEAYASIKLAIAQRDIYDLMVLDGRPDGDISSLDLARAADLIVIPVGVSWDDLQPQIKFANELRSRGIDKARIRFALNQTLDSPSKIEDAKQLTRGAGWRSPPVLQASPPPVDGCP